MNEPNGNQNPSPTVPNRDIFTAPKPVEVAQQPVPQASGVSTEIPVKPSFDKDKIIGRNNKIPKNLVFILAGFLVVLLLIVLVIKVIVPKVSGPKETTIVWWSLEEDADAAQPLINEYEVKNPNVKIQFVKQSTQDYRERLSNAITQGKGPDIFEFHNSWVPMFINDLSPATTDFSSILYPVATNDLKSSKGFLGVPLEYDGIGLFVNMDILRAYGKNPPQTWDDLRALAQSLTVHDKTGIIQQSGAAIGVTSNVDYWQDILALLMLQNGADLTNPNTPLGQSALTFYTNFFKVDHVWDDTLPSSTTDFAAGKLAIYFGKYHDANVISTQNPSLHFAVVPLPQLPKSDPTQANVSYASYWVNGVSKASASQGAAWDFLTFMTSQQSLRELYTNEKKVRGYGNLYPRADMQKELLSDIVGGPFIYEATFAKSWYLYANTFDGLTGINTQVSKPFSDAVAATNGNSTADQALQNAMTPLTSVLASYGLVAAPVATP